MSRVRKKARWLVPQYRKAFLTGAVLCCAVLSVLLSADFLSLTSGADHFLGFFCKLALFGLCFVLLGVILGLQMLANVDVKKPSPSEDVYKALAHTDKLTGLRNRLSFEEDVEALSHQMEKYRNIVFINTDVNQFKSINDTYGHMIGDQVLSTIGGQLMEAFGDICRCYRVGGDEFCLICTNRDIAQLEAMLNKVNAALDRAIIEFPVSLSYGLAEHNRFLHHSLMDVFKAADDAMYAHKKRQHA